MCTLAQNDIIVEMECGHYRAVLDAVTRDHQLSTVCALPSGKFVNDTGECTTLIDLIFYWSLVKNDRSSKEHLKSCPSEEDYQTNAN